MHARRGALLAARVERALHQFAALGRQQGQQLRMPRPILAREHLGHQASRLIAKQLGHGLR